MAWKKKNPDKVKTARNTYRARKKNAPVVEPVSRAKVYKRDKGICGICGKKVSAFHFHVDHVVPLSRGGSHTYGNTQTSHPSCNQKKGNR
jgi:5-methylcytosine-specific restriction endonuclease McrA